MALVRDPYVDYLDTRVVEVSASRAVVEQPDVPFVANHVGVRHASALHAAGYEAARALVFAALGDGIDPERVTLARSEIEYQRPGMGPLTFVAEPSADGWDGDLASAGGQVSATVSGTDENGKGVAALTVTWDVAAAS